MAQQENLFTSLAGEFYVLAQLYLRNVIGTLTFAQTKSVDILATNPGTGRLFRIETKTSREPPVKSRVFGRNYEWMMSQKHERLTDPSLVYCFVLIEDKRKLPRFFVVPSRIVARYVRMEHRKWLSRAIRRARKSKVGPQQTTMRTFRVRANKTAKNKYEDNWDLLLR